MSWSIECGIYYIPFSLEADHARDFYERPSLILVRRGGVSPRRAAVRNIASGLTRQPVRVVKVIITHDKRRDSSSTCRDETKRDETRRIAGALAVRTIFHVARNFSRRKGRPFSAGERHSSLKSSQ